MAPTEEDIGHYLSALLRWADGALSGGGGGSSGSGSGSGSSSCGTGTVRERFIDRDGKHFRYLLNYLRTPVPSSLPLPSDPSCLQEIRFEADFFGLGGLVSLIDRRLFSLNILHTFPPLVSDELRHCQDRLVDGIESLKLDYSSSHFTTRIISSLEIATVRLSVLRGRLLKGGSLSHWLKIAIELKDKIEDITADLTRCIRGRATDHQVRFFSPCCSIHVVSRIVLRSCRRRNTSKGR